MATWRVGWSISELFEGGMDINDCSEVKTDQVNGQSRMTFTGVRGAPGHLGKSEQGAGPWKEQSDRLSQPHVRQLWGPGGHGHQATAGFQARNVSSD